MKRKILIVIATLLFLGVSRLISQSLPSYVPASGLVGWWPFSGNANDLSGNGNNGTVNGATLTTDRFGNTQTAYDFDGTNDYISVSNHPTLNTPFHTISCWVYPEGYYSVFSTDGNYVVGKGPDWSPGNYSLHYKSSNLKARAAIGSSTNTVYVDGSTNVNLTQWIHLACSWDGTSLKIYVNGILENSITGTSTLQGTNTDDLFFGTMNADPTYPYWVNGKIDDIGIWDRALTPQEISDLYNATSCSGNLSISPTNNVLQTGTTAVFNASTSDPSPTFVWQCDFGQGFQTLNNYGKYSGANTNALSITNIQLSEHNLPVRAISTSGVCIDTSNVAVVSVSDTCLNAVNDTILITVTDTLIINALITSVTPSVTNQIKVYPNPAISHIFIDNGNFSLMNGYSIRIDNSLGQQVFQSPINQAQFFIDLSTWSGNGLYFVHLINSLGQTVEIRKIVLQ